MINLKVLEACQLKVVALLETENLATIHWRTDRHFLKQRRQVLFVVMAKRAAMVITTLRSLPHNYLFAIVRSVRRALSLLSVHVTNVVGIILVKLIGRHNLGEFALEKDERFFHGHAGPLEEESVLEATPMLQFVIPFQTSVQLRHAERHTGVGQTINVGSRHFPIHARLFGVILVARIVRIHGFQQWCNAALLFDVIEGS
mmetsp:Transcript_3007/g.4905  ORF Transcript_3007/g.4905 Transcript_3007/m.4905 type:complete len:201 (+) Transcript_3007:216-818(+)